jgi:uncharacterized Tic20 family protein
LTKPTEPSRPAASGLPGGNQPPPANHLPQSHGTARDQERRWGMSCHLAALLVWFVSGFFGWVPPLVIMLDRGRDSAFVREQAAESLNFQLTLIITTVALAGLAVLGVLTIGG